MKPVSDIEALRQRAILSSLAGFPFLLVFACVWTTAAILSYIVPREFAPWTYVLLGMPATPVAIALERKLGYVRAAEPDVLLPLTLQILFVQMVAFPAALLVWNLEPSLLPVALAALVGAHFLPFQWVYRTRVYGILGVVVAVGPYALAVIFREKALHYTGFFVGPCLLIGALAVRSHAKRTWIESQAASHPHDTPSGAAPRG